MTIETTDPLYLTDPYVRETSATVSHVNDRGGILVDIPLFYATSGGQPGDSGTLTRQDGSSVMIATTVYDDERRAVLVPDGGTSPEIGERVTLALDWDKRYRHMRMHTALHLLSAALPYPVTGGAIGVTESRLDFDIPDAGLDKDEITTALNALIIADHGVSTEWITDAQLDANPGLVKTMSVKPPRGSGRVRLVRIGDVDLQPCGGTHVKSTGEIGAMIVSKIEKKGRQNRRVRIRFADA